MFSYGEITEDGMRCYDVDVEADSVVVRETPFGDILYTRTVNDEDLKQHQAFLSASTKSAEEDVRVENLITHQEALTMAREILLEYAYGAPDTPSFPETLSPVQTAVLGYRDSGIEDPECDRHIMWINARVNEINSGALYAAQVLQ